MLPDDLAALVDRVRRHYDDGCFACGRANPIGLHLDDFARDGAEIEAWFRPRPQYRGVPGSLHGGIAATAIDEIQAWAGILIEGVLSVTATLEVRYRRPVTTEVRYRLRGRVEERSGRRLRLSGSLFDGDQESILGRGLYVATTDIEHLLANTGGRDT